MGISVGRFVGNADSNRVGYSVLGCSVGYLVPGCNVGVSLGTNVGSLVGK